TFLRASRYRRAKAARSAEYASMSELGRFNHGSKKNVTRGQPPFCQNRSSQHDLSPGLGGVGPGACGSLPGAGTSADFPTNVQGLWICVVRPSRENPLHL